MTTPAHLGAVCDRCGQPYLIGTWPHQCLCPPCYLGGMPPEQRARLLHRRAEGQRIA